MAGRNLGLNERVEDSREPRSIIPPMSSITTAVAADYRLQQWV